MQLTMCTPSPIPILLDLHHMRQINPRTGARRTLRRITEPVRKHPKLGNISDHVSNNNISHILERRNTSVNPPTAMVSL